MRDLNQGLLQVFAKQPRRGRVKTRLIPDIGSDTALAVYRYCLQHSLDLLDSMMPRGQLWLDQAGNDPMLAGYDYRLQQGDDLGDKMLHALQTGLHSNDRVLLIGSDCLDLSLAHIAEALQALQRHELVLIPAVDGGYVGIGVRGQVDPRLFAAIDWGSAQVLAQTLQCADQCAINYRLMDPLRDIDRIEDLQHYAGLHNLLE